MSAKVQREEIIIVGNQEEFQVETYGVLHLMPPTAQSVFAIFGVFERTRHSTLLYSMGAEEMDIGACDTHYLDDLNALKKGNYQIVDRIA